MARNAASHVPTRQGADRGGLAITARDTRARVLRWTVLLVLACASPDSASQAAPAAPEAPDYRLHLAFEGGSLDDDSTSGASASTHGEPTFTEGPSGGALALDGVDDFVYFADADALEPTGAFTILASFRASPREDAPEWPILDKYAYEAGAWTGYAAYLDGGQPYFGVYSGESLAVECGGARAGVFADNAWHEYAAIFDGAEVRVLVDGELAARCDWELPALPNADWLEVGTRGGEYNFLGALDEITLYDRALSDDEI